ncbi:DMT family transporter [Teredinibacter sp. KSP-S5-2]|uniref:DMT family transporter n=1 Tax=Teredinibacter sp. KSP-S5-2 TaxID=3034506 RepID=UPI002934BFCE|nr:DMT family transporter [Teredinibacter sp. KSP-S5-2]WNO09296.1 DMT family transporter [Teredinibacter sp. KSP-S5-2]
MSYLSFLAFIAGAAIAVQASMNAQLGSLLDNPLLATGVAFISSVFFTMLAIGVFSKELPPTALLKAVPFYLWFAGGMLSSFGIAMFYFLIPKMGVGSMMSFALSGQLIIAILIGHFGWFSMPIKPFSTLKLMGVLALILGVVLVNHE